MSDRKRCLSEGCDKLAGVRDPFCRDCRRGIANLAARPAAWQLKRETDLARWGDRLARAKSGRVVRLRRRAS